MHSVVQKRRGIISQSNYKNYIKISTLETALDFLKKMYT